MYNVIYKILPINSTLTGMFSLVSNIHGCLLIKPQYLKNKMSPFMLYTFLYIKLDKVDESEPCHSRV